MPCRRYQADDKIIAGGDGFIQGVGGGFALIRYNSNGSLDSSFGTGGKVLTPIGDAGGDLIRSLAIEAGGKIIAAGATGSQFGLTSRFALARYNTNGSLDTTFGSGGIVTTLIGSQQNSPNSVALQQDGKIIAAGESSNGMVDDFSIARYLPDGQLDAQFGNGGTVLTPIGSVEDYATSVKIQTDGRILLSGNTQNGANYDFAAVL